MGATFALPLAPGDDPPERPLGRHVWHDHAGAVDEEALLLTNVRSMHGTGDGHRVSMVHVWITQNPDGALAQNNWTLPFLRPGLAVPDYISLTAARGLSLAHDGSRFYREVLRRAVVLEQDELQRIDEALARAVGAANAAVRGSRGDAGEVTQHAFEDVWSDVAEVVPGDRWAVLAAFVDGAPPPLPRRC